MFSQELLRKSSFFLILLSLLLGVGVYHLKNRVSETALELSHIKNKINMTEESLHTLRAEWNFLKSPKRLARLNQKHLRLEPLRAVQIASLNTFAQQKQNGIMVAYRKRGQ